LYNVIEINHNPASLFPPLSGVTPWRSVGLAVPGRVLLLL
jgi:hypothetical protein